MTYHKSGVLVMWCRRCACSIAHQRMSDDWGVKYAAVGSDTPELVIYFG
jgi:hypothetical protein